MEKICMKIIQSSGTMGCAIAVFCIICLMTGTVSAAGTPGPSGQGGKNTPAQGTNGIQAYTMEQTISDQAQMMTIAFDALAFMTGDACSDTFLPPGKVADYAGFQYLRDNDKTQMDIIRILSPGLQIMCSLPSMTNSWRSLSPF
jgi:hypothetical protein